MGFAVFAQYKCTGSAAATETLSGNHPNFLSADEHDTVPANHTIPVPLTAGTSYCYENVLLWKCTSAPDNNCDNFKVWGSNIAIDSPTDKVLLYWGVTGTPTTPVETVSSIATARQDINDYSAGTALALSVQPGDNVINAVNEKTDHLYMQLRVEDGAVKGNITTQVYHIMWDES